MKIYVDDVRTPIDKDWIVIRTYEEFVEIVEKLGLDQIKLISLDHDLGDKAILEYYTNAVKYGIIDYDNLIDEKTGYDCAKWLVNKWLDGAPVCQVHTHSHNGVGRKNIKSLINNYYKNHNIDLEARSIYPKFIIENEKNE